MPQPERKFNPSAIGLMLLGFVALILFSVMAYSSLRRTAARLSCDFYYPYLRLAAKSGSALASNGLMLKSKLSLAQAIEHLQADNFELSTKATQLIELEKENARLRAMLSLGPRASFKPVYAEVIARDPSSWHERFTIGRGTDNGVAEGDLVVAPALAPDGSRIVPATVGRIKSASKHTAVVCTLASEDCKLSVVLSGSGMAGLLSGSGLSEGVAIPTVKFLPLKPVYKPNEIVSSSGVAEATPPAILVGRLIPWPGGAMAEARDHIFAEARVLPAANLDSIRFVAVFTRAAR